MRTPCRNRDSTVLINSHLTVATAAVNSNLKEVSLELGGKSASIVFEDADLDKAAASLAFSLLWSELYFASLPPLV